MLILMVALAQAQDGGAETSTASVRFSENHIWLHGNAPTNTAPLTGLSLSAAGWLAGDGYGAVYLSVDEGKSWTEVLEGTAPQKAQEDLPADEELLLEAEQLQDEALQQTADGNVVDPSAVAQSATELLMARAGKEAQQRAAADAYARPWWSQSDPDIALVARADGIWRSHDAGHVFEQVSDVPTRLLLVSTVMPGAVIAGTDSGVIFSFDQGKTWDDVEDATDGGAIVALAEVDGWILAGGSHGLYRTKDAFHWEALQAIGTAQVQAILPDPNWSTGYWLATGDAILRTDDGGGNFYSAGRQPMRGLRGMAMIAPNHVLAWGSDGVWESLDGGVRWMPVVQLLTDPDVRDLKMNGGLPEIATTSGLWHLERRLSVKSSGPQTEGMSLGAVVDIAWKRGGLDIAPLSLSHRQFLALATPQLSTHFAWSNDASRTADLMDIQTTEPHGGSWSTYIQMCWGGCGVTVSDLSNTDVEDLSGVLYDENGNEVDAQDLKDQLFVVDGEVYGTDQVVSAAANVSQSIQAYQNAVYASIAEAWLTRRRLISEHDTLQQLPLNAQIDHILKIQELDARLDIYTDGAWQQSLSNSEVTP